MNILYTLNSAKRGGAEQHVADLIAGFCSRGHKVYVWCPDGVFVNEYRNSGAEVVIQQIGLDIDLSYIFKLARFIKQHKIDVVHAHELKSVVNSLLASKLAGISVCITHTHTPISEWQIPGWKKFININFFNSPLVNFFADAEIALTESRKKAKINEGINAGKLKIIPNGIDLDKFTFDAKTKAEFKETIRTRYNIPAENFVFGVLGRLTREKGVSVLIKAFSNFIKRFPNEPITLLVAGGGLLFNEMQTLVKELNLQDKVVFTDVYEEDDKVKLYSSLDAFVFPSLAEGFGIVLVEAMTMGLPVIASDLDVLQEVGGSSVIFFDAGNPDDLSDKMYNMYQKRDRLENLCVENRRRVEELYSMKNFIDAYENLYIELLEKNK